MKRNTHIVFASVSLLVALAATAFIFSILRQHIAVATAGTNRIASGFVSSAVWESTATMVADVSKEATIIVRARVVEEPMTRVVRTDLPVLDEKGTIIGSQILETPFADTLFEVVEVLSGNAPQAVTVLQTGGILKSISEQKIEMGDDPLYMIGEEYVLFLVDISGDKVHAPNRQLYRIVSPAGRYRIDGDTVTAYLEDAQERAVPTTLDELIAQIKRAVGP